MRKVLINVEATPSCPASCTMCPRSEIKDHGFMTVETMSRIVQQVDPSFVWELDLAGRGEPTIHPKFNELLKVMRSSSVTTAVTTTGVTLTQKNLDALVSEVDVIRLSVSSIDESIFRKVHVGLDYHKIWKNVAALAEAAPKKVIVHLTGGPVIYDSLPQTVRHLRSLGLKTLNLFPLWNRGGALTVSQEHAVRRNLIKDWGLNASESEYSSHNSRLTYFVHLLRSWTVNHEFCLVGDGSISIGYRGEILGCFQDFGHKSLMGNISHLKLKDVARQRAKVLGKMKVCEGCNSKEAAFKWPQLLGQK